MGAAACGGTPSSAADASPAGPAARAPETAAAPPPAAASPARKAAPTPDRPLDGKVIVIDPGHNGGNYRDPAAVNKKVNVLTQWKPCDTTGTSTDDGYSEAAFTWDVAKRMVKLLKAEGATVKLTRKDNNGVGPCITERAAIGNDARADAAISVHADGAGAGNRGFHVIMPKKIGGPVDPVVGDSKRLGLAVRKAFHDGTGLPYSNYIGKDALDYRNDLGGLNLSTVPKIFIETGNMRNATDAARLKDPAFRQRIAVSLAEGLRSYLAS
nr:N-acetylmuramoyl-L-alanine amidase [Sphaerisporangium rubeum]